MRIEDFTDNSEEDLRDEIQRIAEETAQHIWKGRIPSLFAELSVYFAILKDNPNKCILYILCSENEYDDSAPAFIIVQPTVSRIKAIIDSGDLESFLVDEYNKAVQLIANEEQPTLN